MKVLADRILIKPDEMEEQRKGILIPDSHKKKPVKGTVVAIGPGKVSDKGKLIPINDVEVGDRVLYNKYAGVEVMLDEDGKPTRLDGKAKRHIVMFHSDIQGVITEEE